ncbi:MAG: hypothetical protein IPJ65_22155 [Archangiaceae bacterium]|nr:hypothetical protein [Archangiaceae bacterium]
MNMTPEQLAEAQKQAQAGGDPNATTTPGAPNPNAADPFAAPPPDPETEARKEFLTHCKSLKEAMENGTGGSPYAGGRFGAYGGGMPMGDVDKEALERIVNDDHASANARKAAEYMLDPKNKKFFDELDVADDEGGSTDGNVSLGDLDKQIKKLETETRAASLKTDPRLAEMKTHLETMTKYNADFDRADDGGDNGFTDGITSSGDLKKVAEGNYPEDLKAAANFFLSASNEDLWKMVDTGAEGGDTDGKVSKEDLEAVLKTLPEAPPPSQFTPQEQAYLQTITDPTQRATAERMLLAAKSGTGAQQPVAQPAALTANSFPRIIR